MQSGNTPLHRAVFANSVPTIETLLDFHCDATIANKAISFLHVQNLTLLYFTLHHVSSEEVGRVSAKITTNKMPIILI